MRHLDKCKRICAMAMAALMIIQQGSVSTFAEEQTAIAAAETQAEAAAQAEVENSAEQEKEQSAPETPKKPETTPEAAQQPETTPEAQQPQEPETTPEAEQQPEATPEEQQPEATPEAQPTEEAQPAATATATPTPEAAKVQDLTYNAAGVQVKVHTSTAVAADTQLIVTPVNPDDFDNAALNQWLNDKQVAAAAIYDIHLADAGGNEISVGQASVSLNFSTPVVAQVEGVKTTLSFLHIANGSTVEIGQVNAEGTSASITANGFSPFVFVRTAEQENGIRTVGNELDLSSLQGQKDSDGKDRLIVTLDPADGTIDRNAKFSCSIEYSIPNSNDKIYKATYRIPVQYLSIIDAASGIIMGTSGEGQIGSYTLDKETGLLTMEFTPEFSDNHGNVTGFFNFEASLKTSEIPKDNHVEITFPGSKTFTYEVKPQDVSGEKKVERVEQKEDGTYLNYYVKVSPNDDLKDFVLTDTLGAGQEFVEGSFSFDGQKVDVTTNGNTVEYRPEGTVTKADHYFRYQVKVTANDLNSKFTNSANCKWSGNTEGKTFTSEKTLDTKSSISKDGQWNFSGDTVTWKVNLNGGETTSKEQMGQAVYKDTLPNGMCFTLKGENSNTLVVKDKNNNWKDLVNGTDYTVVEGENGFEIRFNYTSSQNVPAYYIEYTTTLTDPEPTAGKTYTNTGEFTPKDEKSVTDTGTSSYQPSHEGALTKSVNKENIRYDSNGNAESDWTLIVDPKGKTLKDVYLGDNFEEWSQYGATGIKKDSIQISDASGSVYTKDVDYQLVSNETADLDADNNYYKKFKIKFLHDVDQKLTITYTAVTLADKVPGASQTVKNNAWLNWTGGSDGASDQFGFEKRAGKVEKNGWSENDGRYYKWVVYLNVDPSDGNKVAMDFGDDQTVTFNDILPEGMELYVDEWHVPKYTIAGYKTGDPQTAFGDMLKNENGKLSASFTGVGKNFISIAYWTKIKDGYMDGQADATFTNRASYEDGNGKIGEGEATVTKKGGKVLEKTSDQTVIDKAANWITYTVKANQAGATLNEGHNLILEDIIPDNCTYQYGSLEFIQGEDAVVGKPVYSPEGKLTIEIKDASPITFKYKVSVSTDGHGIDSWIDVLNTVTLKGARDYASTDKASIQVSKTNAGATGKNDVVSLLKIDAETKAGLFGAEFAIQKLRYNEAENQFGADGAAVVKTTDKNGKVEFGTGAEGKIQPDILYSYYETKAPSGYEPDSTVYYFYMAGNTIKTLATQMKDAGITAANLTSTKQIIFPNTKEEVKTGSLTIRKIVTGLSDADQKANADKTYKFTVKGNNKYYAADGTASDTKVVLGIKANKSLTINNLPVGNYTVSEVREGTAITNYGLTVTGEGDVTVEKDKSVTASVTNTYSKDKGSLTISKTVTGLSDVDQKANAGKSYKFTVKGSDDKYYKADGTASNTEVVLEIKAGASLTIENLPVGDYTVTEVKVDAAIETYGLTVEGEGKVTVVKDETATAEVTNTYSKDKGSLTISKAVTGLSDADQKANADKIYKFTVKGSDNKYYAADGTASGTEVVLEIKANESLTIVNLPVGTYTVEEKQDDAAIETYGLSVEGTGSVIIKKNEISTAEVTNTYSKDKGSLKISKTVTGLSDADQKANADKTYKFTVKGSDDKYYKADGTASDTEVVLGIKANESLTIANLPVGTYTVEEKQDNAAIETYGLSVEGTGSVIIKKNETSTASVTNTYSKDKGSLTISKKVTGLSDADQKANADKTYKFTVKGSDDKYYKADGTASDTEVVLGIKANESLTIANLPVGTYTVEEKQDDAAIETYGLSVEGTGTVTIKKDETATATVTNTYSKDKGSLTISKAVTGLSDADKEANKDKTYKFTVKGSDNKYYAADGTASGTEVVLEIKAGASLTLENLPVGEYTVEEVKEDASMEGYDLTATGEGTVTVRKDETAVADVTNTFELIPHDVVLTKTDIGGKELAGAKFELAGVQEDGVEIEKIEWISDGTSKTISLKPGTYTLEETAAPDGYNTIQNKVTFTVDKDGKVIVTESAKITVNGKEISEVSAEGNEITIKDTLKGSSITVTKNLVHNNQALSAIDATFYVALYNDEACTERVSEVKAIEFKNASASTASFTDVQVGKTYYIAECDEEGNALTSGTLAGATFLATFTQGNKATVEQENGSTIIYLTNEFLTIPDGFYKEGKLTITKKLLGVDGKAKKGTDKFYAGIFVDEELTELADADTVSANLVELDLNNASEASQTIKFGVANDETLTFYIAETDEDGNPVADDEKFSYKVTYSAKTATFDITHLSASVIIVNREKEETKKTITTTPSSNSSGTTSKTGVKTGDNTPILPFVAILLAAIAAIVVFVKKRFMSKKN